MTNKQPEPAPAADSSLEAEMGGLVNAFIKEWLPDYYSHLVDSDDNAGQFLRDDLARLLARQELKGQLAALEHARLECLSTDHGFKWITNRIADLERQLAEMDNE